MKSEHDTNSEPGLPVIQARASFAQKPILKDNKTF